MVDGGINKRVPNVRIDLCLLSLSHNIERKVEDDCPRQGAFLSVPKVERERNMKIGKSEEGPYLYSK